MPPLSAKKRAGLPNSAFAYIDAHGRRRLPINDEAHVRNALARFNQVTFEDDAARQRARRRLLNAAKKHGILPIGFITGQLRSERKHTSAAPLPKGFVTLLMTDIENSTRLLHRLGRRYRDLLKNVRGIVRAAVLRAGGREIGERAWPEDLEVRVRAGVHSGRPALTEFGYIGLTVHTVARVCSAAHGGQVLISGETKAVVGRSVPTGVRFNSLGRHRLPGIPKAEALFQVEANGLRSRFPPPRTTAAPQPDP